MSHLDLYTLGNCNLVCKRWHRLLNGNENNDVWQVQCKKKLHDEILGSELLSSLTSFKAKLRSYYYAWNPNDCSRNIYRKFNDFMLHRLVELLLVSIEMFLLNFYHINFRNPVAQSTDGCRGKIGFRHGRHAWEIIWEGPLGTVAVIGVATKNATLVCQGYMALLGSDEHSWGWNLVDNNLLHNGDTQGNYPFLNNAPKYQVRFYLFIFYLYQLTKLILYHFIFFFYRLEKESELYWIVITILCRLKKITNFSALRLEVN